MGAHGEEGERGKGIIVVGLFPDCRNERKQTDVVEKVSRKGLERMERGQSKGHICIFLEERRMEVEEGRA